jgi:glycine hydroxymethyltransferase
MLAHQCYNTFMSVSSIFSDLEQLLAQLQPDPEVQQLVAAETNRQLTQINLIPSENITSAAVRAAVASSFMHKYSEGNVGARYYQGNQFIDALETLTIERAKQLFGLNQHGWEVNVQALSGSNANLASLLALLEPGDTIMSMFLPDGGHLSHGWSFNREGRPDPETLIYPAQEKKVHIVAKLFNVVQYATDPHTQVFDYDKIAAAVLEYKPKLIITGGTAYPRSIDYAKFREIADSVGALYLADIAHEAGLIAAGVLPSPVGIADVVTLTTHKTLRAARGALILGKAELIKQINKAVLPGLQGGPFNNNIAGICVGLGEALQPEFNQYAQAVLDNAQMLAKTLQAHGFKLVTDGTDKHLILVDLREQDITGKEAAERLAAEGIIVNMNTIPWDPNPPAKPSGIRLGTPLVTTLGMGEKEMIEIGERIAKILLA